MIVAAYGVPGITVVELSLLFTSINVSHGIVKQSILRRVKVNPTGIAQPLMPVIFNSGSTFLRTNLKFKNTKVVAFVCDNPIVLTRNLKLPLIGAETTKRSITFSKITEDTLKEILIDCTYRETPLDILDHKYKPVDEILKLYEQSDLSRIQTFLYKIKEVENREKVSKLVKTWLLTSAPFSKIEGKLQKEIKHHTVDILKSMLTQSSVDNLRRAIRKVKTGKLSILKAAKLYKVSAFDLRYLLATK